MGQTTSEQNFIWPSRGELTLWTLSDTKLHQEQPQTQSQQPPKHTLSWVQKGKLIAFTVADTDGTKFRFNVDTQTGVYIPDQLLQTQEETRLAEIINPHRMWQSWVNAWANVKTNELTLNVLSPQEVQTTQAIHNPQVILKRERYAHLQVVTRQASCTIANEDNCKYALKQTYYNQQMWIFNWDPTKDVDLQTHIQQFKESVESVYGSTHTNY